MKFRNRVNPDIPETDLIPMLNVMLGLMAYFIIVTMTLSSQSAFNLQLPEEVKKDEVEDVDTRQLPNEGPLVIELEEDGRFLVERAHLDEETLIEQLELFLERNEKDPIFLKPNRKQNYEKVLQTLGMVKAVGGDRVSLIIDDVKIDPEAS